MTEDRRDELNIGNLLQEADRARHPHTAHNTPATKRITRQADPHIEARKVNGRTYYYYRRGVDPPIYLGSADAILYAVKRPNKLPPERGVVNEPE